MSGQHTNEYPDFIRNLPEADLPLPQAKGFLLGAPQAQAVFFEMPAGTQVPLHSHGDQWGTLISGRLSFTIGGQSHDFTSGDSYFVPSGVEHGGKAEEDCLVLEVFADADRWKPKA
jgi:quercetin dioxygenase-like cupin family protein